MNHGFFVVLIYLICISNGSPLENVNMFIGTGGSGYHVGSMGRHAQVPYGNVRVGPDTTEDIVFEPWNHCGGYHYEDPWIRAFSHNHLVGAGATDLGLVGVMPCNKKPEARTVHAYGFKSRYSHKKEWASPGYYGVELDSHGILAEMTATAFTAVHRATFKNAEAHYLYIYVSHSVTPKSIVNSRISINASSQEVTGMVQDNGSLSKRFGGAIVYFVLRPSSPIKNYGTWEISNVKFNSTFAEGTDVGGFLEFESKLEKVYFCLGLSWQSEEQARANLNSESPKCGHDFPAAFRDAQSAARQLWEEKLSLVSVSGSTTDAQTMFYSAMYQSFLTPTTYTESNGKYIGFDKKLHYTPSEMMFYSSDMSIWDEFRTKMPLLAILQPQVYQDIIRSLLLMYRDGGDLPRWPLANGFTGCMIGSHANHMIVDAYVKGLTAFNVTAAYDAMRALSTEKRAHNSRDDLDGWLTNGYVASDKASKSASKTLSYAFDDAAVKNLATILGLNEDVKRFNASSQNYRNLWNSEEELFCGKTSAGEWDCPKHPKEWGTLYTEASAYQWRWFVPHDLPGLVGLFKNKADCVAQLDQLFEKGAMIPYDFLPNPYYWAGNEPALLIPWIYPFAGKPSGTQKWTRWILNHRYGVEADGLPGNNDYGTMSAWLIWADLGLYPLSGTTTYVLGSPVFAEVKIFQPTLNSTLRIVANGASSSNIYVEKVNVNGKPHSTAFVEHHDIFRRNQDSSLEFWMVNAPTSWAAS